jgi:hypothetical protein
MTRVIVKEDLRRFIGDNKASELEGVVLNYNEEDFVIPVIRLDNGDYISGGDCWWDFKYGSNESEEKNLKEIVTERLKNRLEEAEAIIFDLEIELKDLICTDKNSDEYKREFHQIKSLDHPYILKKRIPTALISCLNKDEDEKYCFLENPKIGNLGLGIMPGEFNILKEAEQFFIDSIKNYLDDFLLEEDSGKSYLFTILMEQYVTFPDNFDLDKYKEKLRDEEEEYEQRSKEIKTYELEVQIESFAKPFLIQVFERPYHEDLCLYFQEGQIYVETFSLDDCRKKFEIAVKFQFEDLKQLKKRTVEQEKKFELLKSYRNNLKLVEYKS